MTKYPLKCRNCGWEYEKDQPPPPNAKPRINPEDLAPSGNLDGNFTGNAECPKCGKKGATVGWSGMKPNQSAK